MLIAVAAILVSTSTPPHTADLGRVLTVCELSRDYSRYDGRLIAVRGVYHGDLRQRCPQKCATGEPWPSAVNLVDDKYPAVGETAVRFSTDYASWDALDIAVLQIAKEGRRVEVWVTVVGQLRARSASPLGPCDRVATRSYGHLGMYAAELVVKRVSDVSVIEDPNSTYDYRTFLGAKAF